MKTTQLTIGATDCYRSLGDALASQRPILSGFSKGIDGAVALSLSLSAGKYCDPRCPLLGNGCYAERAEIRPDRAELAAKLARHGETDPAILATAAAVELQARVDRPTKAKPRPPWFRLSTAGSVPNYVSNRFGRALRALLETAQRNSIPVHFPVETALKAARYRRAVRGLAVVRESATTLRRFLSARGAVSVVAGSRHQSRDERIAAAKQVARDRTTASGRRAIVCPAVAQSFALSTYAARHGAAAAAVKRAAINPAKCGACVACADPEIDIVYPRH